MPEGKVAVITGGGTGIGRASALALAGDGYNVVVNYSRSAKEAEETANDVSKLGPQGLAVKANVQDRAECDQLVKAAHDKFGRVDVLVNSAGMTKFIPYPDLDKLDDDVWQQIMQTNVMGAFYTSRAAAKHMVEQGGGAIVMVASIAGYGTNAS